MWRFLERLILGRRIDDPNSVGPQVVQRTVRLSDGTQLWTQATRSSERISARGGIEKPGKPSLEGAVSAEKGQGVRAVRVIVTTSKSYQ